MTIFCHSNEAIKSFGSSIKYRDQIPKASMIRLILQASDSYNFLCILLQFGDDPIP
jgi:hypothetical protein